MEQNDQETRTPPNLVEHLAALVQVVRQGGFSAAARSTGRAVSSISYSIAQLEKQCGYPLLTRGAGRPKLTDRGQALFAEARAVVESGQRFAAHARLLESGQETRLRLLADVLYPRRLLTAVLARFGETHPRVRVQVFSSALNSLWDDLREGPYDLALGLFTRIPTDMDSKGGQSMRLSPICAAGHRLARLPGPLDAAAFASERQIYHVGSPETEVERVGRVFSPDVWTADDVEQIRMLVVAGAGWSFGAPATFEEELAAGRVVRLECNDPRLHPVRTLGAAWPLERPPGILGRAFVETLLER